MIKIIDKQQCNGCNACAEICPNKSIAMKVDEEGFFYPHVSVKKCIQCGLCERICPVINKGVNDGDIHTLNVYGAINKNETVRLASSSGGVFTLLAEYILAQGGVVFGAAFTEDFVVKHVCIERVEEIAKLRGSKYVQSDTREIYAQVKRCLQAGREVLFTGTPCQVEGLLAFLGKKYENLVTQDIICHGVPSPELFRQYLQYKSSGRVIKELSFRDKSKGWQLYHYKIVYADETEYLNDFYEDEYSKMFLKNLSLRPSCYNCAFKIKNRLSDITLADFWGCEQVAPQLFDDKGTSLVFVHSRKGKELFESVKDQVISCEVAAETAIQYNAFMVWSAQKPELREEFMRAVSRGRGFNWIERKILKIKAKERLRKKLGYLKRRLFK